jgi:hypothetical protein
MPHLGPASPVGWPTSGGRSTILLRLVAATAQSLVLSTATPPPLVIFDSSCRVVHVPRWHPSMASSPGQSLPPCSTPRRPPRLGTGVCAGDWSRESPEARGCPLHRTAPAAVRPLSLSARLTELAIPTPGCCWRCALGHPRLCSFSPPPPPRGFPVLSPPLSCFPSINLIPSLPVPLSLPLSLSLFSPFSYPTFVSSPIDRQPRLARRQSSIPKAKLDPLRSPRACASPVKRPLPVRSVVSTRSPPPSSHTPPPRQPKRLPRTT